MKRRPQWADQPLVVCVDGPLAGQWFTAQDWAQQQHAAASMAEHKQRPTAVTTYQATGSAVTHPHVPDVEGAAWKSRRIARDGVHLFEEGPGVHLTDQEREELIAEGVVAVYAAPTNDTTEAVDECVSEPASEIEWIDEAGW